MIVFDVDGAAVQYVPTDDDRQWLLRAVEGEGPDRNEVAQILVNRYAYLRGKARNAKGEPFYPMLGGLVQAYSQPVNPRWIEGGDKYEESWERASSGRRVQLAQLSERRKRHRARDEFSDATVAAVDRALVDGPVDIKPSWLHFSAPGTGRPGLPPLTEPAKGKNQVFGDPGAKHWRGYSVGTGAELAPVARPPAELLKYGPVVLLAAALFLLTEKK